LELEESVTTPPTYLTETELITLMDKNQIGTDSTIHEHIKTILTREFAIKTNQTIKPAKLGLALIETYK
jgi:DNA topoisomerase-3